jgi:hypothetical protein
VALLERKVTWLALAVIALSSALGAVFASSSSPPPTRDQRWRLDIAYVARELPLLRAGGLGNVSPAAWNAAAAKLEAQVPRLTDGQLAVGLAQLVAMLHDDQTQVEMRDPQFYPVVARWFGSGLYLVVVPPAGRTALGSRLLAVDGKPIAQVMASISSTIDYQDPALRADTELSYLRNPALLHWLGITSSTTNTVLSVEPASGGTQTIRVAPVSSWAGTARVPQPLYEQDGAVPVSHPGGGDAPGHWRPRQPRRDGAG